MIPLELLLKAYSTGFFPMGEEDGSISWHSPDPRAIIPLDNYNIPRSTKQILKKHEFELKIDFDFEATMRGCSRRNETWITEEIIESYLELHRLGFAHSIESLDSDGISGGLYGVALGSAFFGESMFSMRTGASKAALAFLIEHLNKNQFSLLDIQYMTPHLGTFGAVEIPRPEYLMRLKKAMSETANFLDR